VTSVYGFVIALSAYGIRPNAAQAILLSLRAMADRLTQLQDAVNQVSQHTGKNANFLVFSLQQADNFTNSLGILQQTATPTPFNGLAGSNAQNGANKAGSNGKTDQPQNEDHTALFSQLIARTAKDIELLVDSLPSEESSAQLQSASLAQLERENAVAAESLKETVRRGEAVLKEVFRLISYLPPP